MIKINNIQIKKSTLNIIVHIVAITISLAIFGVILHDIYVTRPSNDIIITTKIEKGTQKMYMKLDSFYINLLEKINITENNMARDSMKGSTHDNLETSIKQMREDYESKKKIE